jgi:membrane associated rhomboid family serine protease
MPDSQGNSLDEILRQIAAAAPQAWYPADYSRATGIPRDALDPSLDQLRMTGLVRFTDWVRGNGQGYALTPEGRQVLDSPRDVARLRAGKLESPPPPRPVRDPLLGREGTWERGEAARNALLSPLPAVVTMTLILLNVAWFIGEYAIACRENGGLNGRLLAQGPGEVALDKSGALAGGFLLMGQWWRLLTCCFVHMGLLHLGVNMYSLYVIGPLQESMWGHLRYLTIYLISGIVGSCTVMVVNGPSTLLAGASGAIFGVMGSLITWILLNRQYIGPIASRWLRQLIIVLLINVFISALPHISAAAHFGGGIAGVVAALLVHEQRFGTGLRRWLALAGLPACLAVAIGAVKAAEKTNPAWNRVDWEVVRTAFKPLLAQADQIQHEKIAPILNRSLQVRTPDEVRQVIEAFGQQGVLIDKALAILRDRGAYKDEITKEKRREEVAHLEAVKQEWEGELFRKLLNPFVADANREAFETLEKIDKQLLQADPAARDPASVKDAIEHLEETRVSLTKSIELLTAVGPFANERPEAARQFRERQLEADNKLAELAGQCLSRSKSWTKEQQSELEKQLAYVKGLQLQRHKPNPS